MVWRRVLDGGKCSHTSLNFFSAFSVSSGLRSGCHFLQAESTLRPINELSHPRYVAHLDKAVDVMMHMIPVHIAPGSNIAQLQAHSYMQHTETSGRLVGPLTPLAVACGRCEARGLAQASATAERGMQHGNERRARTELLYGTPSLFPAPKRRVRQTACRTASFLSLLPLLR